MARTLRLLLVCSILISVSAGCYLIATQGLLSTVFAAPPETGIHEDSSEAYEGVPKFVSTRSQEQFEKPVCKICADSDSTQKHKYLCQQHNLKSGQRYRGIEVAANRWIKMACEEAHQSVKDGGGPFGAIVVQIDNESNQVIRHWRCRNLVTKNIDPTAHAEVNAIRTVAHELGVFNLGEIRQDNPNLKLSQPSELSHCEIYSSCEPCPMCYAAIRWARIDTIVFAATRYDAAEPGVDFSDLDLYRELATPYEDRQSSKLQILQSTTPNSLDAFNLWKNMDKVSY